jgi:hypothetical protein
MAHLTREELAARRARRAAARRRRGRWTAFSIALPALAAAVLLVVLGVVNGGSSSTGEGLVGPPVAAPTLGPPGTPPDVTIASAGDVELRLPVDRRRVTAIAFHAVENTNAVELTPGDDVNAHVLPRDGRAGPETGSVDVGAPATTPVYAPVTGVVMSVVPYRISGQVEGYEVIVSPATAKGVDVRITHLEPPAAGEAPTIGEPVTDGVTVLGQVRDFSHIVDQEIARFTSDSGNHVHIEVVRSLR